MSAALLPISAVVPTCNRAVILRHTLESLARQTCQPEEIICVDASDEFETKEICASEMQGLESNIIWLRAQQTGAASQRNEGVPVTTQSVIWFFDDDILFEPECVARLWRALQSEADIGGVNATIKNQGYTSPGLASRLMFSWMNGGTESTYAGRVIGPAINLLPEDSDRLPEIVPMEWLNTTCTMYRLEALPAQPFGSFFTGYSLMEDLALSLEVGKKWKLANARTARIFHDSQSSDYKSDQRVLSCMELTNRYYVMTKIMDKRRFFDHAKLAAWELFSLASITTRRSNWRSVPSILTGKLSGARQIIFGKPLC